MRWLDDARAAGVKEPTAMTLATAAKSGAPSARMVLLKGIDRRGFHFFTNYLSRKGQELKQNPRAALVLYWPALDRQIRITGRVSKLTAAESDEERRRACGEAGEAAHTKLARQPVSSAQPASAGKRGGPDGNCRA